MYRKAMILAAAFLIIGELAASAAGQTCTPPPNGLVAWYNAEGNANDRSGNGNHGTLQNGSTFAIGHVGQAFMLDGTDDFVQLPMNASLEPDSITVEGWIDPQTPSGTISQYIYAARVRALQESFSVGISSSGAFGVEIATTTTPVTGSVFATAPNAIQFGTIQHVALTYDAADGTLAAFVNGSPVTLNHIQGPGVLTGALRKSVDHVIGRRQDSAAPEGPAGAAHLSGLIDELSIYDRALSASEVLAIFNAGTAGKCAAPTAAGVTVGGRIVTADGRGIGKVRVFLTAPDGTVRMALTNPFGYYGFEDVQSGESYVISVRSKRYAFVESSRIVSVLDQLADVDFVAAP